MSLPDRQDGPPSLLVKIISGEEQAITFGVAAKLPAYQTDGKPSAVGIVHRHAGRGVDGHRLESVRVGGRRVTTQEAVERFMATLNTPRPYAVPPKPTIMPPPAVRPASGHDAAVRELAAAGLVIGGDACPRRRAV